MNHSHEKSPVISEDDFELLLGIEHGEEWSSVADSDRWRCFGKDWRMILCEEVRPDANDRGKVDLIGLLHSLNANSAAFPWRHPGFCLFVQFQGNRGEGIVRVEINHSRTGKAIFQSKNESVFLGSNSLGDYTLTFRLSNFEFPEPGLYWVQLLWNSKVLGEQPLVVR